MDAAAKEDSMSMPVIGDFTIHLLWSRQMPFA
jgi:hypothetical protein